MSNPSGGLAAASLRPYHNLVRAGAALTAVIIGAGALVTTTGSGLSVPDWPTTFGTFFPPLHMWVNGVEYEHSHRVIAGAIGLVMMAGALWVLLRDERRGVRWLAGAAIAAVLVQAGLGGLTVLLSLPPAVSASHGTLAQTVFCMMVALSMVTSPAWSSAERRVGSRDSRALQILSVLLVVTVWVQLILGAAMRHLQAGLAIPDFPLSHGHLIPPEFTPIIALVFAHRVCGLAIAGLALALGAFVALRFREDHALASTAARLTGLVLVQVGLGASVVWTGRDVLVTSLHVLNGALVLVTSLVVAMWACRLYGAPAPRPGEGRRERASTLSPALEGGAR